MMHGMLFMYGASVGQHDASVGKHARRLCRATACTLQDKQQSEFTNYEKK